jgi:hypothetical protein
MDLIDLKKENIELKKKIALKEAEISFYRNSIFAAIEFMENDSEENEYPENLISKVQFLLSDFGKEDYLRESQQ